MTSKLDDLLPAIKSAHQAGLSFDALKKQFAGRTRSSVEQLRETLDTLVRKGAIRELIRDGKPEYYFAGGRPPADTKAKKPEASPETRARRPEGLLTVLRKAEDTGMLLADLRKQLPRSISDNELKEELAALSRKGLIRVLVDGKTEHYFVAGRGPTAQSVGAEIVRLILQAGFRLSTAASLKKQLAPLEQPFLEEGLEQAVKAREIAELIHGTTKCYLHRDIARQCFVLESPAAPTRITLEDILPVYRRLKEEQGGFSGVRIHDLLKALNVPKERVHPLLIEEARAGRISLHRSSSVELPAEVSAAGIQLPGFSDPFVSFAVKKDRSTTPP